jgi:HAMP domain-containing protein
MGGDQPRSVGSERARPFGRGDRSHASRLWQRAGPGVFPVRPAERTAIKDGAHDLSVAHHFQEIGIGLLVGLFALVLAIMLYFARRLTIDVVRPVETLQLATHRLRAGSLEHRIELPTSTRHNEIEDLADAFNEWPAPCTPVTASSRGEPPSMA